MPPPLSAGILLFRSRGAKTEVLLIRPGGPFWKNRHQGAWMIPKGGVDEGETLEAAAVREFGEELGTALQSVPERLCRIRQSGGKVVEVFAAEGDFDIHGLSSADFEMEWPRGSGRMESFPEAEEARWMTLEDARGMMLESQLPILDALEEKLKSTR